ncbi:MAG: hypothetical protein ABL999_19535 [Pyrinomonadaceae bacterium]
MSVEKDIAIDRVRKVRHKISASFDHDTQKMIDHYLEYQKKFADRLEPMTRLHYEEAKEPVLTK